MDELSNFFPPPSKEMIDEAERQYNRDLFPKNKNIRGIPPPNPPSDFARRSETKSIDPSNPEFLREAVSKLSNIKLPYPPLESLPCANVEVTKYKRCLKSGTKACSACKLVSYCSPVSACYILAPSPLMLHLVGVSKSALAST